jgi:hypothetical protein
MLRFVIIFTFLSLYFVSYSQKYNAELLKSYTENELDGFDNQTIEVLEFAINNAAYFTPLPQGKEVDLKEIEVNSETVKFTDLGLKIEDKTQYYRIKGTSKMLVIKSLTILKLQLNKH